MSKKILGIALTVVGVALMVIPGVGQALGLGLITTGIAWATVIGLGLEIAGSFLMGPSKPKGLATSPLDRLQASLIPTTPRKIVFGYTAFPTDVRYQAYTGSNQEYLDMIVCHASHEVHSIDELWLDNEQAWSATGGVLGRYSGYLTVQTVTLGTSSNGIAIDGTWTSHCTLTGCAYSHLRFKLTGTSSNVQSPFATGVTSRMTFRGKGAKRYDPRLDSTVTGGSGSQRATDQTTWTWDDNASRNPALQELFYELGWKINGKLAVGKGVPAARIDLASYAVAANMCDESITLNGGGTEPRYRSDGVVSEADDPGAVRDTLCATMNAMLRDAGGKLSLTVIHNDLATPVVPTGKTAFDQYDVQAEMQWEQTPDLTNCFNIVRGQRIDPSNTALYQPVDYPEVSLPSPDGIDRIDTFNLPMVQSNGQAQRLAKQRLQRNQYQGKLTFTGQPSFWGLNLGDPFPFSHPAFGWTGKPLRCASQQISRTGATQIVAVEENAAIYAWANNEAAAVTPGAPVVYNPLNHPLIQGVTQASLSAAPGDGNRVRFSMFEQDTLGWAVFNPSSATISSFFAVHDATSNRAAIIGSFTGAAQNVAILNDGATTGNKAYRIPVTPGERIFAGASLEVQGTWGWQLNATFKDDSNATIGTPTILATGVGPLTINTPEGGFVTVPAGAVYLSLESYIESQTLGTGAFTLSVGRPIVCGAGLDQTTVPAFSPGPASEAGAQVTRWIEGPKQSTSFKYDYTGTTAETGEFSRDLTFQLMTSAGQVTSGVTWSYAVTNGTANGFTSASGSHSMSASSGTGTLTAASLGSNSATVIVTAAYNGQSYVQQVTLAKALAAPPTSSGSGSGTGTIASKTSGFTSISNSTFVDVTGALVGQMPTGKTTANVGVALQANPQMVGGSGVSWTVECKVMRDISGTPTQIGSTQTASSDYISADPSTDPAYFNFSISDTGLTAGTTYTWRAYMRVSVGTTHTHYVTGSVTVTA